MSALLFSAAAATQARSDDRSAVVEPVGGEARGSAVVDKLALVGEASADIEANIHRAVLRGLTDEGVRVLEPPADATRCADPSCVKARAAATKADYLIGGEIRFSDRNYELTLELRDGRDGRTLATKSASCPICSMREVEAAAASAAVALAASVTAPTAPPLQINSEPEGAMVFIDGSAAGVTPFTQAVPPGEHRVAIKKEGYRDEERTITIDGTTGSDVLMVPLVAVSAKKSVSGLMPLAWAAVGLGGASFITGVALLVMDERPFKDLCDGEYVDMAGRCRFQYNTLAGGVTGLVAGAGLIGTGVALLLIDRKRRGSGSGSRSGASARLNLGVHPRGLTLSGRF